jgi:hypothetical protein
MGFRVRLLVCGYEPEQTAGRNDREYGAERWWVHTAAYSAQGAFSLPWWPVPEDTLKGDLFIIRLAAFHVPEEVRNALGSGRIEVGKGLAGSLVEEAIEYSGFPLFGGDYGDQQIEIPGHPEFDPDRAVLGHGLAGLAVAHSAATRMPEYPEVALYEALLGTFVPFPDVIPPEFLGDRFGRALGDLTTPMCERTPDQINVSSEEIEALTEGILQLFPEYRSLSDSIF